MDCAPTSNGSPLKPSRPDFAWHRRTVLALIAATCLDPGLLAAADAPLLPPEQAFRFSARALDDRLLEMRFTIADGYYLYRDKVKFTAPSGGPELGAVDLPPGKVKHDQFFGNVETYRGTVVVKMPMTGAVAGQSIDVAAESQGCADVGVCYPPTRQKLTLAVPATGKGPGVSVDATPPKKNWFQ
jgi:thioredoxin:protein disulfide reductase